MAFSPRLLMQGMGMGTPGAAWNRLKDVAWTSPRKGIGTAMGIGAGIGIGHNVLANRDYSVWGNMKRGALGAGAGMGAWGLGRPAFKGAWKTATDPAEVRRIMANSAGTMQNRGMWRGR